MHGMRDAIEMDQMGSTVSSLATEIGIARRRNRSLRRTGSRDSYRENIITDLPSRNNIGFGDVLHSTETVTDRAETIVDQMEQNEADPIKSMRERLETLREMPQNLTVKRQVRSKLLSREETLKKHKQIPLTKRFGYSVLDASLRASESWKELYESFIPWNEKLKIIEGYFGSGVATYFRFLRSLFFINFIVFIVCLLFVVVPQVILIYHRNETAPHMPFQFGNLFTGEGYLSESVLFYGYYSNDTLEVGDFYYSMPSAYFFSALASYFLVFALLSLSMAVSFRKNFIEGARGGRNVFANKVFCGWDFGIATQETAILKSKSIHTEFKELLEETMLNNRNRSWGRLMYLWSMRLCLNVFLAAILGVAAYFTWKYLSSNALSVDTPTAMMISLTVTIVIHLAPIFLIWLLNYESYDSPRTATYVTIARTFLLDAVLMGVLVAYRLNAAEQGVLCWETALGQEIYRLVLLDFLVGLVGTPLAQFVRRRIHTSLWPGIGYPEIDVARNTINLLYNEALFFVGLYFSPILSLVILIKLWMTFYVRYWGAMRDCKPSDRMWRAAQTETVFLITAFIAFILVLVLYGYILSAVRTSWCGPFRGELIPYEAVVASLSTEDSHSLALSIILYFRKPGFMGIVLLVMLLSVYYLRAIGKARKRVVILLKEILHLQAKDKTYLLGMISKYTQNGSESAPPQNLRRMSVDFRSEQDLATPSKGRSPRSPEKMKSARSLFTIWDPNASIAFEVPVEQKPKPKFNPVFTRSDSPQDDPYHHGYIGTPAENMNGFEPMPATPYAPFDYDERTPSRIAFPEPPKLR